MRGGVVRVMRIIRVVRVVMICYGCYRFFMSTGVRGAGFVWIAKAIGAYS